ncbi:VOC family protein [Bauldia litoralis]|uniref:VOC family protein n=1 Tax=Bauldia litoralis TaxID=665467 RepID=UPI0032656800
MAGAKSRTPRSSKPPARAKPASPGGRAKAASTRTRKPATPAKPAKTAPARKKPAAAKPATRARRLIGKKPAVVGGLHQVALLANDLDTAVDFYRNVLGVTYIDRFDPPGLAFFDLGNGLRLLLSATASEATLYFSVDNISKAVRTLSGRGVSFLQKPAMVHRDDEGRLGKKGVEEWMAFFRDPSGNLLALVARK